MQIPLGRKSIRRHSCIEKFQLFGEIKLLAYCKVVIESPLTVYTSANCCQYIMVTGGNVSLKLYFLCESSPPGYSDRLKRYKPSTVLVEKQESEYILEQQPCTALR